MNESKVRGTKWIMEKFRGSVLYFSLKKINTSFKLLQRYNFKWINSLKPLLRWKVQWIVLISFSKKINTWHWQKYELEKGIWLEEKSGVISINFQFFVGPTIKNWFGFQICTQFLFSISKKMVVFIFIKN